jgi:hypothetical protein
VTGQRQTSILENGQFETAWVVAYRTSDGVKGSVTVPATQYNAENVSQLISEQVAANAAVHQLSGSASQSPPPGAP